MEQKMGILSHWISAREARIVARALKSSGYRVTIADCNGYLCNVAAHCEPMHKGEQRKVQRTIAVAIGLQPELG